MRRSPRGRRGDRCASWRKSSKKSGIKGKKERVIFMFRERKAPLSLFPVPPHRFFHHRPASKKRPPPPPPPKGSMRCVNRTPCSGLQAPPRGRAARRAVVIASASAASSSSSSPDAARSRGASAKAVASSSGRPAVDAPTSSPEIVGRGSNGAATSSANPSGPLLKAVRSSR